MRTARYIIVLDRYDDDDYLAAETGHGLNDGTDTGGCAQVAAELQEAMEQHGTPAGFFNVIAREVYTGDPPEDQNVSIMDPEALRSPVAAMLTRERRQS